MAIRGRKPKPAAELKLHGTFREDRHGCRADSIPAEGEPEAPADLNGEAMKFWQSIVPDLTAKRVTGRIDTAALVACCDLWAKYRKASRKADRRPSDKTARIATATYYALWERAAAKVGLSPVDRARLQVPKQPDPQGSVSGFARKRG